MTDDQDGIVDGQRRLFEHMLDELDQAVTALPIYRLVMERLADPKRRGPEDYHEAQRDLAKWDRVGELIQRLQKLHPSRHQDLADRLAAILTRYEIKEGPEGHA